MKKRSLLSQLLLTASLLALAYLMYRESKMLSFKKTEISINLTPEEISQYWDVLINDLPLPDHLPKLGDSELGLLMELLEKTMLEKERMSLH